MKTRKNGAVWDFERKLSVSIDAEDILGLDGGTTTTVSACVGYADVELGDDDPPAVLGRAVSGSSNHYSVGEIAAIETLERVMAESLLKFRATGSNVRALCLAVSGVNHPSDQERILIWMAQNDAVEALASGKMGKLDGYMLIAGTGTIAYGFTSDGREAHAAGAGPVFGDWGSGYGIAAQALTALVKALDGRGPSTMLTSSILEELAIQSPDDLIGWTYEDTSRARIVALVPVVVRCAESGDKVANENLQFSVQELAASVKAVVHRLCLCDQDGIGSFPLVMVGGILAANNGWDIGSEVIKLISKDYPGVNSMIPKVEPAVGAAMLAWNLSHKESRIEDFKNHLQL